MFNRTLKTAAAVAVLGLSATAAQAGIFLSVGGAVSANNGLISNTCFAGCTTQNFNSTALGALPMNYVGNGAVVTGTLPGFYAQPTAPGAPNTSNYLVTPSNGSSGSVTITPGGTFNYFGFFAGSIDTFNSITFFNGATQVLTITGTQLFQLPNPDLINGNQQQAAYFNLILTGSDAYTSIVLASSGIAFETDNHTFGFAVVPVPASAALLLSGLLGMVVASRRQKKASIA